MLNIKMLEELLFSPGTDITSVEHAEILIHIAMLSHVLHEFVGSGKRLVHPFTPVNWAGDSNLGIMDSIFMTLKLPFAWKGELASRMWTAQSLS